MIVAKERNIQAIREHRTFSMSLWAEDFYIDSGASMHMTSNKDRLVDVEKHKITRIEVANRTPISVEGSGKMRIKKLKPTIEFFM